MKKVALTALVLAFGLAACQPKAEENAANETAVENNAEADTNAALGNAEAAAENALENAGNAVENLGDAAANAVDNTTR